MTDDNGGGELALLSLTAVSDRCPCDTAKPTWMKEKWFHPLWVSHSIIITVKIAFYLYSEELSMELGDSTHTQKYSTCTKIKLEL